jgi:hypothetical protein
MTLRYHCNFVIYLLGVSKSGLGVMSHTPSQKRKEYAVLCRFRETTQCKHNAELAEIKELFSDFMLCSSSQMLVHTEVKKANPYRSNFHFHESVK